MQRLADRYEKYLSQILASCSSGAVSLHPADFPLADLDEQDLQLVMKKLMR